MVTRILDEGEWANRLDRVQTVLLKLRDTRRYDATTRHPDVQLIEVAGDEFVTYVTSGNGQIPVDNQLTTRAMRNIKQGYQIELDRDRQDTDEVLSRLAADTSELERQRSNLPDEETIKREEGDSVEAEILTLKQTGRYKDIKEKYDIANSIYKDRLHEAVGDPPRNWPSFPLWIILIGLGIIEFLINLPVFEDWLRQPIFAFGATLAVALAVAWNSEVIGKTAKQRRHLKLRNTQDKFLLKFTTFAFILAIVAVFWGRFSYYWGLLGGSRRTLDGGLDWSAILTVLERSVPTLGFNLIIWAIGAAIAWGWYEKVPGLRETYQRRERLRKKLLNEEERVKRTSGEKATLFADQKKVTSQTAARRIDDRMRDIEEMTGEIRSAFSQLARHAEAQSNSAVSRYRAILAKVPTQRDGISADVVGFEAANGNVHSIARFAAADDNHSLSYPGYEE